MEPGHNSSPQDPSQIRPPHQTIGVVSDVTTDHTMHQLPHQTIVWPDRPTKINPSDQTTTATPDQQITLALQSTIPDCSTSNQHSTHNFVKWYKSCALFVGWVKAGGGGGIWSSGWTLQSILSTRSAWRFRTSFRFNLNVVRSVSGVPWVGQGLPCPFSEVGFLCRCSISDIISALRFSLASRKRFGFVFLHLFQMD